MLRTIVSDMIVLCEEKDVNRMRLTPADCTADCSGCHWWSLPVKNEDESVTTNRDTIVVVVEK